MKETNTETAAGSVGEPKGNYASVNGLNMYYEIHGPEGLDNKSVPLVLIHGSLSAIGTSFGKLLPHLAKSRRVIALELQGHGRTGDIDRPLKMTQMMEDTAALLRLLGVQKADVLGYSRGSGIAFELAAAHPDLVRKLVLAAVVFNSSGFHPGLMEGIANMKPEDMAGTPFYDEYKAIAPNPDNWATLVTKTIEMDMQEIAWPVEMIQSVKSPILLIIGDSDIVRPEHAVEMFRMLGGGVAGDVVGLPACQLAVLPGTTHVTLVQQADMLVPMLENFLGAPMPEAESSTK